MAIGRSVFYKKDNLVNGLAGWFLMGLLMISVFCAGGISYPGYAYSDRYILFFIFPFVFLAAKGMVAIKTRGRPRLLERTVFYYINYKCVFCF